MKNRLFAFIIGTLIVITILVIWLLQSQSQDVIKIAFIGPLTGPNSSIGIGMRNASKLAIDQANQSTNSSDYRFELKVLDDASKPDIGVNAALRAAQDADVVAVNGHYNTPVALATSHIYNQYNLPVMIYGIGSSITLQNKYTEIFRIPFYDLIQMELLAKFINDELKFGSVYILDDGTAYGKPLAEALINNLEKYNIKISGHDSYNIGDLDFTVLLTKVKKAQTEVIITASVFREASLVRRQMKQVGLDIPMIGVSGIFTDSFIKSCGESANIVRAPWVVAPLSETPGGTQFVLDYQNAGFKDPYEAEGLPAYAGMQVIIEAIRQVGPDREKIRDVLHNNIFETAMGPIAFDNKGDNKFGMLAFYQVQNDEWVATHQTNLNGEITKYPNPIPYNK